MFTVTDCVPDGSPTWRIRNFMVWDNVGAAVGVGKVTASVETAVPLMADR
jgi:hypothetical protein